ncbi:MAG: class I SAM-dependent methyltransferase [Kiritimatiellaeota bacterium]|nr:class I SAM-dependent methyltransferase [Kiritimatiellota bacterium]
MSRVHDSEGFHLRSSAIIRWVERGRVRAVLESAGSPRQLLEVGCGAGMVLSRFSAERLVGVDLSEYILREKARFRLAGRSALLILADGRQLPFADGVFNTVVCTEVIEHVPHPGRLVRELARVAAPGARVVLTIPNEPLIERLKGWVGRLGMRRFVLGGKTSGIASGYDSPAGANEWHLHRFDLTLLRRVIDGALALEKIRAIPSALLPLHWVVRCCPVQNLSAQK